MDQFNLQKTRGTIAQDHFENLQESLSPLLQNTKNLYCIIMNHIIWLLELSYHSGLSPFKLLLNSQKMEVLELSTRT